MSNVQPVASGDVNQNASLFLAEVLDHLKDRPVLARVELPAPHIPFRTLVARPAHPMIVALGSSSLWGEPSRANYFATWGRTAEVLPYGDDPFGSLTTEAATLFRRIEPFFFGGRGPGAQLIGGMAFSESSGDRGWSGFGAGRFVLPRWEVRSQQGQTWFCLNLDLGVETDIEAPLREYAALCDSFQGPEEEVPRHLSAMEKVTHMDLAEWTTLVEEAKKAIGRGELHKVVLARRSVVETTRALDVRNVLLNLERAYPGCFLFSFEGDRDPSGVAGGASAREHFVGASPERLVSLQGHRFFADALAGSVDPARPDAEGWLRGSDKDRQEHAFVVDEIVERVRLLCTDLQVPAEPELKRLKNIVHLHTPITGQLKSRLHVLELLSLLHPTPAVCGVPVDRARKWIEDNEQMSRGWYAGPVGWFDERGQGEFAVALRSGLIGARRAELYAGGGIVRDSDPASEYHETSAKLGAMLSALGLSNAGPSDVESR